MTDYDLLLDIKTTPDDADDMWPRLQLWNRYQPVIYKRTRYLMSILRSKYEQNDIVQELFIAFHDAVDYVDMEKIPSEDFKFGTVLFFFLRKQEKKIKDHYFRKLSKDKRESYETLFSSNVDSEELNDSTSYIPENKMGMSENTLLFFRVELPRFQKKLDYLEKKVFQHLLSEKVSIREISRREKLSYAKTRNIALQIRAKAKNHFKDFNYVV